MSFHQTMQNIYRTWKTIRNKKEILLPSLSSRTDPKLSFSLFASLNLSEYRKIRLINVNAYHFVGFFHVYNTYRRGGPSILTYGTYRRICVILNIFCSTNVRKLFIVSFSKGIKSVYCRKHYSEEILFNIILLLFNLFLVSREIRGQNLPFRSIKAQIS